jgi:hypothetical protein
MHANLVLHEPRHIERLARSLHSILKDELGASVPLKVCCGTVVQGLALTRSCGRATKPFEFGRPWSTTAALGFLAGRGFVFDPRLALEALSRVERRHVVDRRRLVERRPRHRSEVGHRFKRPLRDACRSFSALAPIRTA